MVKSKTRPKISLISLGCARNLVDSEVIAGKLESKGFAVTGDTGSSDVLIINTCGFIEEAKRESIDIILKGARLKKEGRISKLIVCGCLTQRYPGQLSGDIPEIDALLGVDAFRHIDKAVEAVLRNKAFVSVNTPRFVYSHKSPRRVMTPPHYAYVKIAEGCRNRCSYCAIYNIRGRLKSRPISSIISEIKALSCAGKKAELNIIAQDTSSYGMDRYNKAMLPKLLRKISRLKPAGWIRLLYTHPLHFTDELIEVIAEEDSICKYIDLPIQHISDKILTAMNRKVTRRDIESLIKKIRRRIPGVCLRTSVIVGFPNETEKDFKQLFDFISTAQFERLGAFIYSREDGTPAYGFKGQVAEKVKQRRFDSIMSLQQEVSEKVNARFSGKRLKVLIEEKREKGLYAGRTEYDAPEVDGMVYVRSKTSLRPGKFAEVKITDTLEYDLIGKKV